MKCSFSDCILQLLTIAVPYKVSVRVLCHKMIASRQVLNDTAGNCGLAAEALHITSERLLLIVASSPRGHLNSTHSNRSSQQSFYSADNIADEWPGLRITVEAELNQ